MEPTLSNLAGSKPMPSLNAGDKIATVFAELSLGINIDSAIKDIDAMIAAMEAAKRSLQEYAESKKSKS